jgi:AcrR family transcriptional regulator
MERSKKECILEAARKAFERFGFKKTSVDEIARDAGVAKGTVYLAAESKEDLFYQAVHREVRSWVAEASRLIDPRRRADELLIEVAAASLEMLSRRPLARDLLLGICSGQLPGWVERLEELRALGRSAVEEILRLGVKQGVFQPSLDVEMVARILQDLQVSGYVHAAKGEDVRRRMMAGIDLVLNGLRTRPGAGVTSTAGTAKARA